MTEKRKTLLIKMDMVMQYFTDLSENFDSINHDPVKLVKLGAYSFDAESLKLIVLIDRYLKFDEYVLL